LEQQESGVGTRTSKTSKHTVYSTGFTGRITPKYLVFKTNI
jgi:hypothetical protein